VAQGDPYDIQDAKAGLWVIFRDYDGFQVELPIQTLQIQGRKATVDTHFTLSYWPSGIPERKTTIEGDLTLILKPSWWSWKICGVDLDESLISSFRW
jgi:hypothetical protein